MRLSLSLLSLIALPLVLTHCGADTEEATSAAEQLLGRWELERGLRNNVETTTLGDLYYDFGAAGVFSTNLLGDAQTGTYSLSDDDTSIETEGVKLPLTYDIVARTDSTLHLRARHKGYLFDFEMVRGGVGE